MYNLQKQLEDIIKTNKRHTLLLHSCCAPCSSHVLDYLSEYFDITLLFYNPNIIPKNEYDKRLQEQKRLISQMPLKSHVTLLEVDYNPDMFLDVIKGLENEPEGGKRCNICFEMRLREAAIAAKKIGADYFTTTLSISPHKDSKLLDQIALELESEYSVKRLPSDFKKKDGYKHSIQLSREYNLYRQNWCGCPFSKAESEQRKRNDINA